MKVLSGCDMVCLLLRTSFLQICCLSTFYLLIFHFEVNFYKKLIIPGLNGPDYVLDYHF